MLNKCDERNDDWASEVRIRVEGALSDLHAAEARYHKDCMVAAALGEGAGVPRTGPRDSLPVGG